MGKDKEKTHEKKGPLGMAKRALSFSKSKSRKKDAEANPEPDLTEFADLMDEGIVYASPLGIRRSST